MMTNMVVVCIDLVECSMYDRLHRIERIQNPLTRIQVLARTIEVF